MHVYVDIETLPDLDMPDEERRALVKVPANYRDEKKIAAYVDQHAEEAWRRTALDPMRGRVLCIGVAVGDADPVCIWEETEAETLASFWRGLERQRQVPIVAHNLLSFDGAYLAKRALKHHLPALARRMWCAKRWGDAMHVDTLTAWQGPDYRARGRLDDLAAFLGVDRSANPIHGSEVYDRWLSEDHDAIRAHVLDDVRTLREVHQRLRAAGMAA